MRENVILGLTASLGPGPLTTAYDVTSYLLVAATLIAAALTLIRASDRRRISGIALLLFLVSGVFIVCAPIVIESIVAKSFRQNRHPGVGGEKRRD